MIVTFLSHTFRRFFRSPSMGKEIATNITLGIIALMVMAYSLAIGFVLEKIIVDTLGQSNPIAFLNGLLVYYFIGEFMMRYLMQGLPALDVQPYLHLPVARSRIVNFLLGRSLFSVFNIYIFLLFTPFALTVLASAYGASQAWAWLLSIWLTSLVTHFIVMLFKYNLNHSVWGLLLFIAISGALAASDYFSWFQLSDVSETFFSTALHGHTTVGVLLLSVVLLYVIAYRYFLTRLYAEELHEPSSEKFREANWTFLETFGLMGAWIKVELKMIFRHRRTREVFLMNIFFLLYCLVMYKLIKNQSAYGAILLFGTIGTGIFAANYGQFLFSWQGRHFDFTLTQPTSIRLFVESKYWLLAAVTGIWFLISIPFVFLGPVYLLVNFVCTLFNIGINIFLVMNMAMWGTRPVDLTKGGTLNYEGMGAAQWVMGIPFMASPFIFFMPFRLLGYPVAGLVAVGMAGLIGIVFRRKLIDITARRLYNMRYAVASNFRKE